MFQASIHWAKELIFFEWVGVGASCSSPFYGDIRNVKVCVCWNLSRVKTMAWVSSVLKSIYSPVCILVCRRDGIGVDSSGMAVEIVGALGREPTCALDSTRWRLAEDSWHGGTWSEASESLSSGSVCVNGMLAGKGWGIKLNIVVCVEAGIVIEVVVKNMAVPELVPDVGVIVCRELAEIAWISRLVSCCWGSDCNCDDSRQRGYSPKRVTKISVLVYRLENFSGIVTQFKSNTKDTKEEWPASLMQYIYSGFEIQLCYAFM